MDSTFNSSLKGKRIYLRKIIPDDKVTILRWSKNAIYHKWANIAKVDTILQAQKNVSLYIKRPYSYAICLNTTNKMIGIIELYKRTTNSKELGYLLDQKFWRKGLMSEALSLILDYAFNNLHLKEIWAGLYTDNVPSKKLLEKFGFHYMYEVDYSLVSSALNKEDFYLLKFDQWNNKL